MIDSKTGAGFVMVPKCDGSHHPMLCVPPSAIIELTNRLYAKRRAQLVANLKDSGSEPKDALAVLSAFDAVAPTRSALLCADPEVIAGLFLASYKLEKPDATMADVDALGLDLEKDYEFAMQLLHFKPGKPKAQRGGEAKDPLAENGDGAGATTPSEHSSPKPDESVLVSVE